MSVSRSQMPDLLRLRMRVTWRTYTATFTARMESLLFIPAVLLTAHGIQMMLVVVLNFALDPHVHFRSLSISLVMLMHVSLLMLFAGWSIVPALGFRTNEAIDLRRLQLLPIRFPALYTAASLGFAGDLSTVLPLSFCVGVGRFLFGTMQVTAGWEKTPENYGLLGLILLLFLALLLQGSMLTVQLFQTLLPKVDLTRILMLFFVGFLVFVVALNMQVIEYPDGTTLFDELYIDRYNVLPTGPLALAIHELALNNTPLVWRFLGQGALWVLGLAALNAGLMWMAWSGTFLGVENVLNLERLGLADVSRGSRKGAQGWPMWVRHPILVVAYKDFCNLLRNRHFFFYKTLPGLLAPTTILLAGKYNLNLLRDQYDLQTWFIPLYLGLALFIFVTQANLFVANYFGFEREEISALLTSPVKRHHLIQGKSLFFFVILIPDMLLIASLSLMLLPHPVVGHWLVAFGFLFSIAIILLSLGNMSSVLLPYFTPLDRPVITLQGAILVGLANTATLVLTALLMIPATLLIAGPWFLWDSPGWYALTLPVWVLWLTAIGWGFTAWAGRLMPDYEEWIQLRVRGVL